MDVIQKTCPCCGKTLPLGLFQKRASAKKPYALEMELSQNEDFVEIWNRYFLKTRSYLPLHLHWSPVEVETWIEVEKEVFSFYKEDVSFSAPGHLASDLPGFPGSVGAKVYCNYFTNKLPQIIQCEDERVQALPENPAHDEFAALYRRSFGNYNNIVEADLQYRTEWKESIFNSLQRKSTTKEITPPPFLAGMVPAEVLITPPLDTGQEAFLATIGLGEVLEEKVELFSFVKDPADEFIRSFAEFAYLSRIATKEIAPLTMIGEKTKIPGTNDMQAWLLVEPLSFLEIESDINFLQAIPIHYRELKFAEEEGAASLLNKMLEEDVIISDLQRESL